MAVHITLQLSPSDKIGISRRTPCRLWANWLRCPHPLLVNEQVRSLRALLAEKRRNPSKNIHGEGTSCGEAPVGHESRFVARSSTRCLAILHARKVIIQCSSLASVVTTSSRN